MTTSSKTIDLGRDIVRVTIDPPELVIDVLQPEYISENLYIPPRSVSVRIYPLEKSQELVAVLNQAIDALLRDREQQNADFPIKDDLPF